MASASMSEQAPLGSNVSARPVLKTGLQQKNAYRCAHFYDDLWHAGVHELKTAHRDSNGVTVF